MATRLCVFVAVIALSGAELEPEKNLGEMVIDTGWFAFHPNGKTLFADAKRDDD